MPYQAYEPVPQGQKSPVAMPMRSYNTPLMKGSPLRYSSEETRSEYLGYQSPHVALATHHKLRLKHSDLVSPSPHTISNPPLTPQETQNPHPNPACDLPLSRNSCSNCSSYRRRADVVQLCEYEKYHQRWSWALGGAAEQTQLWSSILLFTASIMTVIVGVFMISAYLISIKAANKVSTVQTWMAVIVELMHVGLWISVAVTYRTAKNTQRDLWGWACSEKAAQIQHNFVGIVDFDKQTTWQLAISSAGVTILSAIVWYLAHRRKETKKALLEHEEMGF